MPLQEAQAVVGRGEAKHDGQILPLELPQTFGYRAEVSVGAEADEDERAEQEGDEQLAAQLSQGHAEIVAFRCRHSRLLDLEADVRSGELSVLHLSRDYLKTL